MRQKITELGIADAASKTDGTYRGEDIPSIVEELSRKKACAGVTGEDLFVEYALRYGTELEVLERMPWAEKGFLYEKPALCLFGPKGKKISDFGKNPRVGYNRKYEKLATNFCQKLVRDKREPSLFELSGGTEEAIANGFVDAGIDIVCTGKSLAQKGLEVYERVFAGDIVVVGRKKESETGFSMETLYRKIAGRKQSPSEGSYTRKLFSDPSFLLKKYNEETFELTEAFFQNEPGKMMWEASDVLYFLLVMLAQKGVRWREVENELRRRTEQIKTRSTKE